MPTCHYIIEDEEEDDEEEGEEEGEEDEEEHEEEDDEEDEEEVEEEEDDEDDPITEVDYDEYYDSDDERMKWEKKYPRHQYDTGTQLDCLSTFDWKGQLVKATVQNEVPFIIIAIIDDIYEDVDGVMQPFIKVIWESPQGLIEPFYLKVNKKQLYIMEVIGNNFDGVLDDFPFGVE
ncbi:hypothetical protein ACA910_017235 [Epithemia clementina (nom. ined.)]